MRIFAYLRLNIVRYFKIVILAFSLILVGNNYFAVAGDNLAEWQNIRPAVAAEFIGNKRGQGEDNLPGSVKVKVGYPYELRDYDWKEKAIWTAQVIWSPRNAVSKRVLKVFKLSDIGTADWNSLRTEFRNKPADMAFISRTADGKFIGTPVKWNKEVAASMAGAFIAADLVSDKSYAAVAITAGEIHDLAVQMKPNGYNFDLGLVRATGSHDQVDRLRLIQASSSYKTGDISAFSGYLPVEPVYVGFTATPENFKPNYLYELITNSGAQGQPLGKVMPSWPNKD